MAWLLCALKPPRPCSSRSRLSGILVVPLHHGKSVESVLQDFHAGASGTDKSLCLRSHGAPLSFFLLPFVLFHKVTNRKDGFDLYAYLFNIFLAAFLSVNQDDGLYDL